MHTNQRLAQIQQQCTLIRKQLLCSWGANYQGRTCWFFNLTQMDPAAGFPRFPESKQWCNKTLLHIELKIETYGIQGIQGQLSVHEFKGYGFQIVLRRFAHHQQVGGKLCSHLNTMFGSFSPFMNNLLAILDDKLLLYMDTL